MTKFFNIYYWIYVYVYFRASALIDKQQYDKAIKIIVSFLKKKRFATEAIYYELGRAYIAKKEYPLALESFLYAVKYNTRDDIFKANSLFYLCLTYYEAGHFKKAIMTFEKTINIKQKTNFFRDSVINLPNLYCYLGRAYINIGEADNAFKVLNEGLKYDPSNKVLQQTLSEI